MSTEDDDEITKPLATIPLAGSMALCIQQDGYTWESMHKDYPRIRVWQMTDGFRAILQDSEEDVGIFVQDQEFRRFYKTLYAASASLESAQRFLIRKKARTPKQLEGTGLYEFTIKDNMHIIHLSQETVTRCGSCIKRGVHPDNAWKPARFRNNGDSNSILLQPCDECKRLNKEKNKAKKDAEDK